MKDPVWGTGGGGSQNVPSKPQFILIRQEIQFRRISADCKQNLLSKKHDTSGRFY